MTSTNFYSIPKDEKIYILTEASNRSGLPAYAVEKDWWVVQTLKTVFSTSPSTHMVFKGGTSLSKGWNLISRMSEDIDLANPTILTLIAITSVLEVNLCDLLSDKLPK